MLSRLRFKIFLFANGVVMPLCHIKKEVRVVMFNATFNNISVISWRSVLLVEKTTDLPQVTYKLSHNVVSSAPCHERDSNSQR